MKEPVKSKGETVEISRIIIDQLSFQREKQGLTRAQLARKSGQTPNIVANYEEGRVAAKLEVLEAMAKALGMDLAELIPKGKYDINKDDTSSIFIDIDRLVREAYSLAHNQHMVNIVTAMLERIVSMESERREKETK